MIFAGKGTSSRLSAQSCRGCTRWCQPQSQARFKQSRLSLVTMPTLLKLATFQLGIRTCPMMSPPGCPVPIPSTLKILSPPGQMPAPLMSSMPLLRTYGGLSRLNRWTQAPPTSLRPTLSLRRVNNVLQQTNIPPPPSSVLSELSLVVPTSVLSAMQVTTS